MRLINLEHEILHSEILRVTILMVFFFFIFVYLCLWSVLYPGQYAIIFKHSVNHGAPFICLFSVLAYCSFVRYILKQCERKGVFIPNWTRFLTSLIETSIPTLFIYLLAQIHPPVHAILSSRILFYFMFIILSALYLDEKICIFTGLVAALEYSSLSLYYLHTTNLSHVDPDVFGYEQIITRSILFFAGGCITAFVTKQIKSRLFAAFKATKEREKIVNLFGHHVSPEVVNMLLSQRKSSLGDSKFVCVLFLDIRNFTLFSENKSPEEVVKYLNQLYGFMIDIINTHHGIINKFLGDGFMSVFGAPISGQKDTDNAVRAAEEILAQVEREVALGAIPDTKIGIGIHCGRVIAGNVGASHRQEYTIIGDVVNLASRIEDLNKKYTSELLISEDVYLQLQEKRGELLGDISVIGRQKPIKIYRLK